MTRQETGQYLSPEGLRGWGVGGFWFCYDRIYLIPIRPYKKIFSNPCFYWQFLGVQLFFIASHLYSVDDD